MLVHSAVEIFVGKSAEKISQQTEKLEHKKKSDEKGKNWEKWC